MVSCQVRYWTVVIASLLVFTATVTPFEIAFLDPALDGRHSFSRTLPIKLTYIAVLSTPCQAMLSDLRLRP